VNAAGHMGMPHDGPARQVGVQVQGVAAAPRWQEVKQGSSVDALKGWGVGRDVGLKPQVVVSEGSDKFRAAGRQLDLPHTQAERLDFLLDAWISVARVWLPGCDLIACASSR